MKILFILGENYTNYDHALVMLGCASLLDRRKKLCETFSKRAGKHSKYKNWFNKMEKETPKMSTRRTEKEGCPKYRPVPSRTNRYKFSPLPFLTELLNN